MPVVAYAFGAIHPAFAYAIGMIYPIFAYALGNNRYLYEIKQRHNDYDTQAIN